MKEMEDAQYSITWLPKKQSQTTENGKKEKLEMRGSMFYA